MLCSARHPRAESCLNTRGPPLLTNGCDGGPQQLLTVLADVDNSDGVVRANGCDTFAIRTERCCISVYVREGADRIAGGWVIQPHGLVFADGEQRPIPAERYTVIRTDVAEMLAGGGIVQRYFSVSAGGDILAVGLNATASEPSLRVRTCWPVAGFHSTTPFSK